MERWCLQPLSLYRAVDIRFRLSPNTRNRNYPTVARKQNERSLGNGQQV